MEEVRPHDVLQQFIDAEDPRNATDRQKAREALMLLLGEIFTLQEKCADMEKTSKKMLQDSSQSRMIVSQSRKNARGKFTMDELFDQDPNTLILERGGSVRLDEAEGKFLHWCVRCGRTFKSENENPAKCGHCRKKYWRGDWERDVRRVSDDSD